MKAPGDPLNREQTSAPPRKPGPIVKLVSEEALALSAVARHPESARLERVTAYEDIINLEVGDTSLSRARSIERDHGMRQIFLKFEGNNPTGTQKDRIAFYQCLDALRRGYGAMTVATCGNYGASTALAAHLAGLALHVCIPREYHSHRVAEMEALGANVTHVDGSYEDSVEHSRRLAADRDLYDANPGGNNTSLQLTAYGQIAWEIYDILRDAPRAVAVPVSNGTLLAGIYRGFLSLHKRGKTSRIPRMVAASTTRKNPVVTSYLRNLRECVDLDPRKITATEINEPLINWHAFDGQEALDAVWASSGFAAAASDDRMRRCARMLREREGIAALPASTVGLIALLERHIEQPFESDRYVAVVTGKK